MAGVVGRGRHLMVVRVARAMQTGPMVLRLAHFARIVEPLCDSGRSITGGGNFGRSVYHGRDDFGMAAYDGRAVFASP